MQKTNSVGFDNEKYLEIQTKAILERVGEFDKLYFEVGGRLTSDGHVRCEAGPTSAPRPSVGHPLPTGRSGKERIYRNSAQ